MSLNINRAHLLDILDHSDHYLYIMMCGTYGTLMHFKLKPANSVGLMVAFAMGLDLWTGGGESSCSHRVSDIASTFLTIIPRAFQKHVLSLRQLLSKKWPVCKYHRQHLLILQQLLLMPSLLFCVFIISAVRPGEALECLPSLANHMEHFLNPFHLSCASIW